MISSHFESKEILNISKRNPGENKETLSKNTFVGWNFVHQTRIVGFTEINYNNSLTFSREKFACTSNVILIVILIEIEQFDPRKSEIA